MSETRKPPTFHPLIEMTIVRLKEFGREPEVVFWVFAFPLLLTVALGFAFREKPPDKIPVGVAQGFEAQKRLKALEESNALMPRLYTPQEGREELRRGRISLLVTGDEAMTYRLDPTRPDARTARVEVDAALQKQAGRSDKFSATIEPVTEQGSRYIDFLVPGLLGMNLMGTSMWSIGFSVVNARLKKLLRRFISTPMRKSHYLLAQFLSRMVFMVAEVAIVAIFAWLVFDVAIRGSIALFSLTCILGGCAFAGVGILIASRVKTLEGVSGLMNVIMMPMWICSGVFFSYERFPDAAKPIIRALPLTALNDALRAVMNDGYGFAHVAPQLAILLAWTVVAGVIGLKIFRWQ
ncbi:MAG TPA: ABC transporter permease [Thermoanaerobaculia bacterium]|jgi:ABC-type multidrug transport system permease subunit|nr:ABC transporter permease [Thermoanaerobaculia bacterium]